MPRILVISSDVELAEQIASTITSEAGFTTTNASSGLDGVRMLGDSQFDLVIIDDPLDDVDSWDICRQAHAFGSPIISLSTIPPVEAWQLADKAGFDFYFKKPFSYDALIARTKVLLRRYGIVSKEAAEAAAPPSPAIEKEPPVQPQEVAPPPAQPQEEAPPPAQPKEAAPPPPVQPREVAPPPVQPKEAAPPPPVQPQEEEAPPPAQPREVAPPPVQPAGVEEPTGGVRAAETIDPRVLKLLEKMLDGDYTQIIPVVNLDSKNGFSYPDISGLLGTDDNTTIEILESLASQDVLIKEFYDILYYCPKCGSFKIHLSVRCPVCNYQRLRRCNVLEHFNCGNIAPEEDYTSDKGYTCPKCKKDLKAVGLDYRNLGLHYKCPNCGELSSSPHEDYHCLKCQDHFAKQDAKELTIYSYKFNEAQRLKIETEVKRKLGLIDYFKQFGYKVTSPAKVTGKSGREHELAIYGTKNEGAPATSLALDIAYDERGVSETEVLKLHAKAFDINADKAILIAMPEISKDALPFASQYNVIVIPARDLEEATEKLPGELKL